MQTVPVDSIVYEYRSVPLDVADMLVEVLNELGAEGWEAFAFTKWNVYLKRKLRRV